MIEILIRKKYKKLRVVKHTKQYFTGSRTVKCYTLLTSIQLLLSNNIRGNLKTLKLQDVV